jgi:class 3 adenylate cyclase
VDGSGSRQLLIISDWAEPYGEPGLIAYDAFARDLASHDGQAVLVLDGTIGGGGKHPDVERRIGGARAAADAASLSEATLLGTAGGAPVAAMLAAQDHSRFSRLILYDTFPSDGKKAWASGLTKDPGAAIPDMQELEEQLKTASAAWEWARDLWKKGVVGPKGAQQPPFPPVPDRRIPDSSLPPRPGGLPDGLDQLLQRVARLEAPRHSQLGAGISGIALPTLVLEVRADGDPSDTAASLGMEVASEIPGAIHRVVSGRSRWPWAERRAMVEMLAEAPREAQAERPGAARRIAKAPDRVLATILFTDIVGSTERLAELGDAAWRELLARHHQAVRAQLARFDGREVDTAGDGFLAAFETPARAVRCAVSIRDQVKEIGLSVRCGLHTGECEQVGDKLVGIAVHIGARIAAQAAADEVLVSSTVRDLVAGAGISFVERGSAMLKGLPGEWLLFAVTEVR